MSKKEQSHHRGVGFSVWRNGGSWAWSIDPPKSVRGWSPASGEVAGERGDAIARAKLEIEMQEKNASGLV